MKKILVLSLAVIPVLSFSYMRKVPESDPYYETLVNADKQDRLNKKYANFTASSKSEMGQMRKNGGSIVAQKNSRNSYENPRINGERQNQYRQADYPKPQYPDQSMQRHPQQYRQNSINNYDGSQRRQSYIQNNNQRSDMMRPKFQQNGYRQEQSSRQSMSGNQQRDMSQYQGRMPQVEPRQQMQGQMSQQSMQQQRQPQMNTYNNGQRDTYDNRSNFNQDDNYQNIRRAGASQMNMSQNYR